MKKTYEIDIIGRKELLTELLEILKQDFKDLQITSFEPCEEDKKFSILSFVTQDENLVNFWLRNKRNINLTVDIKTIVSGVIVGRTTYVFGDKTYLEASKLIEDVFNPKQYYEDMLTFLKDVLPEASHKNENVCECGEKTEIPKARTGVGMSSEVKRQLCNNQVSEEKLLYDFAKTYVKDEKLVHYLVENYKKKK